MLRLYNTLTRKKEKFIPISDRKVGFYSCGITAYFYPHIGNMRRYVMDDIVKRTMLHDKYYVTHVENITDVGHLVGDANTTDDKMRVEAEKEHKTMKAVAMFYFGIFENDMKLLNIIKPSKMPFASEHVPEMISLIKKLDDKGFLYRLDSGIYFDTSRFKDYGRLTGSDFDTLNAQLKGGARVERVAGIRNITDFAVWRFAEGTDMIWDSPWGRGFPGWHIECSVLSMMELGEHFDVHTGGVDHIAVHHSNEIAQSESATGKKFVNYWVHHEFLTVNGQKMSKSLGNIYTVQHVLERGYSPMALRMFMLSGHYRQILNFTFEAMDNIANTLNGIYSFLERLEEIKGTAKNADSADFRRAISSHKRGFFKALDDDINTPLALAEMHAVINYANARRAVGKLNKAEARHVIRAMLEFDKVLGLNFEAHLKPASKPLEKEVQDLLDEREKARKSRDFKRADEIRKLLKDKYNVALEDTSEGVRWHKD